MKTNPYITSTTIDKGFKYFNIKNKYTDYILQTNTGRYRRIGFTDFGIYIRIKFK